MINKTNIALFLWGF